MSLYAASKKSNELFTHTYSHLVGIQSTGLLFFTVYGPWGRPDIDLPPVCRTSVKAVKSVFQENGGHEEEQIQRRTGYWVSQAG